jgi:glutathione S-transferase
MLKVLGRANSANVQKVLWCLAELDQPFEQEDIGGPFGKNQTPEFLRLNPNGLIPTLLDGEWAVWESNTILRYLGNKFAPAPLYPTDAYERSVSERWMDWQLSAFGAAFMPLFVGLWREKRPLEALQDHHQRAVQHLTVLDAALAEGDFVAGEALTLADIALGPALYRWYALELPHGELPNLKAWYQRLAKRPAFQRHVASM